MQGKTTQPTWQPTPSCSRPLKRRRYDAPPRGAHAAHTHAIYALYIHDALVAHTNPPPTHTCPPRVQLNNIAIQSAGGPSSPKIVFVDGSYHMNKARVAEEEYLAEHIPGARFFDIDTGGPLNTVRHVMSCCI